MSMIPSRRSVSILAIGLLLAVPTGRLAAATELGAATPEELVERLQRSAESQDFAELAACLAPEDRAVTTLMMILGAGMMTAFAQMGVGMAESMAEGMAEAFGAEPSEESAADAAEAAAAAAAEAAALQSRFEELLERHGVAELMADDDGPDMSGPDGAAELLADVDQVALIGDLMRFMREAFPDSGEEGAPASVPVGTLEELTIDGDRAHGRVGGEEVAFVRVDERWFIELPKDDAPSHPPEEVLEEATAPGH